MLEDQLRAAVKKRPETEYAIAKGAGIAPAMLYRFMRKERSLSMPAASKLAAYLGLSLKR